jgi:hypothetical protein
MNFKYLILLSFSISTIGAATIVGSATQASAADVCKNVSITIENGTNDPIKVTKFEYQDTSAVGNPFRTENLLGIDGQEKLNVGKSFTKKRDLRSIKNESTRFRVTYRHQIGGVKFEDPITEVTNTFDCRDGIFEKVTITK